MTLHLDKRGLYESQGMEDGPESGSLTATSNACIPHASTPNNGGIEMANFPTTETHAPATPPKINGDVVAESEPEEPPHLEPQPETVPFANFSSPLHSPQPPDLTEHSEVEQNQESTECLEIAKRQENEDKQGENQIKDISSQINEFEKHDVHNDIDDVEEEEDENESSSDCDHLVIDEEVKPRRRKKMPNKVKNKPLDEVQERNFDQIQDTSDDLQDKVGYAQDEDLNTKIHETNHDCIDEEMQQRISEQYMHRNPYFAKSIFELTNHYNTKPVAEGIPKLSLKKIGNRYARKRGKNGKPKLREYTQYLGLQPTVQFKCSKCGSAGFESLQLLNEHLVNCTAIAPMNPPPPPSKNTTNFKVTRKVFLCSACGTYYENWNLFLHMREVHKRFICLYCLGMFPLAEKLSAHLVNKHNCTPAKHADEMEFARAHREPCFLMCCDCQMVFTEQDYVTRHKCIGDDVQGTDKVGAGGQDVQVTTNQLVIETSANKDGELSLTGTVELSSVDETESGVEGDIKADKTDISADECVRDNKSDLDEARVTEPGEEPGSEDDQDNIDEEESNPEDDEDAENEKMDVDDGKIHNQGQSDQDGEDSAGENEDKTDWQQFTTQNEEMPQEERKVPKVTLKLGRMYGDSKSQDINAGDASEHSEGEVEGDAELSDDSDNAEAVEDQGDQGETDLNVSTVSTADEDALLASSQEGSEVDIEGTTSQEELDVDMELDTLAPINLPLFPNADSTHLDNETSNFIQTSEGVDKLLPNDAFGNQGFDMKDDTESKELSQEEQDLDAKEEVSTIPTAGNDVAINEIELDQPLDKFDIKFLLQKCLRATIPTCLYCNHARKIAVNGKQLGLHAIAEHRYSSIVKSITAEELIPESFNNRIQECLEELDKTFFTLEDNNFDDKGETKVTLLFECFQCRYSSTVHKELYMHNRKLHAKALLLCTMCKTSFYSYSELLCHLCPGVYSSDRDREIHFRCCFCVGDDLPSAFRLVVHFRKKHNVCDVCLETCHNQMRLSNHVWKHKLHHLCYRCGIAYRNKPDITKHLFWKHGTESVECKKCLQKKWPHVYHFCQPPASFPCDQCTMALSKASKLKVHKRIHAGEFPHVCTQDGCGEKFISKRLLMKHDIKVHQEPEPVKMEEDEPEVEEIIVEDKELKIDTKPVDEDKEVKEDLEKPKAKVDVYDLPELNLSESDSDSEDESTKSTKSMSIFKPDNDLSSSILINTDDLMLETSQDGILKLPDDLTSDFMSEDMSILDRKTTPSPGMDNTVLDIWNNFKTYQETIAKTQLCDGSNDDDFLGILTDIPPVLTLEEALRDHDYCPRTTDTLIEQEPILDHPVVATNLSPTKSADHDYCFGSADLKAKPEVDAKGGVLPSSKVVVIENDDPMPDNIVPVTKPVTNKDSSDSSSDSDSSSCTCGSNCSCSSGSSSSSSDSSESDSSSEEGRRRQQVRREKRRKPKSQRDNVPPSVAKRNQAQNSEHRDSKKEKAASSPNSTLNPSTSAGKRSSPPKETPIRDSDLSTTESDTDEEFYDKEPQKIANKLLAEKREKLMQMAALGTHINGAMLDSRPPTPSIPEDSSQGAGFEQASPVKPQKESKKSKKSKSKKKKKKKTKRAAKNQVMPTTPYHHQQVAPLTLTLPKSAPVTPVYNSPLNISNHISNLVSVNNTPVTQTPILTDHENSATRASKRRRVPNKFYGYSSDEENEKIAATGAPNIKFRKMDLPSPKPTLVVPPITIKAPKTTPVVNPISIRMSANPEEMRVQPLRLPLTKRKRTPKPKARKVPPPPPTPPSQPSITQPQHSIPQYTPKLRLPTLPPRSQLPPVRRNNDDSGTDSNSSTSDAEEEPTPAPRMHKPPPPSVTSNKPNAPPTAALYCYCRCPYDEVSEMIGCDSDDCAIEWFHFECVGIMVPPKGQWFCPDCRKKKQQRREMLQHAQVN